MAFRAVDNFKETSWSWQAEEYFRTSYEAVDALYRVPPEAGKAKIQAGEYTQERWAALCLAFEQVVIAYFERTAPEICLMHPFEYITAIDDARAGFLWMAPACIDHMGLDPTEVIAAGRLLFS